MRTCWRAAVLSRLSAIPLQNGRGQHNAKPLDIIGPMLTRYDVPDSLFQMGSIFGKPYEAAVPLTA